MIKKFLKNNTTYGLFSSMKILRQEFRIMVKHRKGLRKSQKLSNERLFKLHIGCGHELKNGWLNIDLSEKADLTLDMREPMPFHDHSCSIIYSEHFLEHLEYPNHASLFIKECFRVLEPGGLFSIGVPDTEWPIMEYNKGKNNGYFQLAKKQWHPEWCKTEMEHINQHFRDYDAHRFAYDFKTLVKVLAIEGFKEIKRREFDPNLDNIARKLGTLYVNALKPEEM